MVETAEVVPVARTVGEWPVPEGAVRVQPEGFGAWLGTLPLRAPGVPVRTHDGRVVGHSARAIELPMVSGDLQQCADSLIRLRAAWQVEQGAAVSFHATSGDTMPLERWKQGEKPIEKDGRIAWVPGGDGTFEGYLSRVFIWAGTRSLAAYDTVQATGDPVAGDLLIAPGSPGHTVLLLDVARRGEETFVLVGEGYMPAQDFHVELGPEAGWWPWEPGVELGHWDLRVRTGQEHRRFR